MSIRALQLAEIGAHAARARWRWARLSAARLGAYQDARMRLIIDYAWQYAPFYRAHWRGHDLADWRSLPLVDKQLMMQNFSRFNTAGVERERALQVALTAEQRRDFVPTVDGLTVGLSSGTSGHRGLFLVSPAEQRAWAGVVLSRMLELRARPYTLAFFLRSNSNLYEQLGGQRLRFRYFDLMQPLEQSIAQLNALQPDILVGPPSLLALLAGELGQSLRIAPERLISVAEVLEPQERTRIEQRFGVALHQVYQCTEGLLALACLHGALHIQEDLVAIQCEPLAGDPARFQPIVTDLWRRTQPIVRYRLNDILTLSAAPCPCGSEFRVIERIEGRCDDLFEFATHAGALRPVFPDLIRRMILLASDAIEDYQASQDRAGALHIALELRPGVEWAPVAQAVEQSARRTLAAYDCVADTIVVERGIPALPPGAKRRRVWRKPAPVVGEG